MKHGPGPSRQLAQPPPQRGAGAGRPTWPRTPPARVGVGLHAAAATDPCAASIARGAGAGSSAAAFGRRRAGADGRRRPTPVGARLSGDAFLASLPPDPRTRGDTHGGPGASLPVAPLPGAGVAAVRGRPAAVVVLHGSASSGPETLNAVRALLLLTLRLRAYTHWVAPPAVGVDGATGSWFLARRATRRRRAGGPLTARP